MSRSADGHRLNNERDGRPPPSTTAPVTRGPRRTVFAQGRRRGMSQTLAGPFNRPPPKRLSILCNYCSPEATHSRRRCSLGSVAIGGRGGGVSVVAAVVVVQRAHLALADDGCRAARSSTAAAALRHDIRSAPSTRSSADITYYRLVRGFHVRTYRALCSPAAVPNGFFFVYLIRNVHSASLRTD